MEVNILDYRLRVSTVDKKDIRLCIPAVLELAFIGRNKCRFFSFTRTCDDYTIVLDEMAHLALPSLGSIRTAKDVWRPLAISAGPDVDFRQVTGISKIAKSVIIPLADNDVSVYCISTYQADYVLVKERQLEAACCVLAARFRITTEHSTSSVVVDIPPELVRPVTERWGRDTLRPITRPFTSLADHTFHVASMDPGTLCSLCVPILDLMFYWTPRDNVIHRCHDHEREEEAEAEVFFMFIVVGDEITLVLDSCALQKFPPGSLFNTTEKWKMIKTGDFPNGLGFDECGIVAMMIDPLADIGESDYYLSTYYSDHALVPAENFELVQQLLLERAALSTFGQNGGEEKNVPEQEKDEEPGEAIRWGVTAVQLESDEIEPA